MKEAISLDTFKVGMIKAPFMALVIGVRFYIAGFTGTRELVQDLGETSLSQLSATIESQLQPAYDQARFLADLLSRIDAGRQQTAKALLSWEITQS